MPLKGHKQTQEHIQNQQKARHKSGWWRDSIKTKKRQSKSMIRYWKQENSSLQDKYT